MRLKLIKASREYQKQITDMLEEWYASGEKIIPYLAVLPEYRHRNIGQNLLEDCFEKAKSMGRSKLKIGIVEENKILRKWYQNFGFEHVGTKKYDFFPFTCGYMEKSLED